jgi:alpha-tubulin suppressor-like RCC1 family protein
MRVSGQVLATTRSRRGWRLRAATVLGSAGVVVSGLLAAGAAPATAGILPMVSAGGDHACALLPDGTVWCWGRNTTGQLGIGTDTDSLVPQWVRTLPTAIDVSAGHDETCAVDVADQVWCWGANAFGQVGNGTTDVQEEFPQLVLGVQATQVSVGDGHVCALTLTDTVDCWGDNNYGELGDGSTADAATPQPVAGLTGVTQVAAGYFHACALEATGAVWCWGSNSGGALGNGTKQASDVPVAARTSNAIYVAAGADDSCAIVAGGDLMCWGNNNVGQLGVGNFTDQKVPAQVVGMTSGAQQVSLGQETGCAITAVSGPTAFCWGDAGGYGQLGNGNFGAQSSVPVPVFGLTTSPTGLATGPAQISVGTHHACVVLATSPIECWGEGTYGNLGDGLTLNRAIPTPIIGLPTTNVYGLSAGTVTGCAVTTAGASCWGQDTGDGSPLATIHTSAVGVLGLPGSSISQISAAFGACAVVMLGGLSTQARCWGDNSAGELGNNTTTDQTTPVKVHGLSGVEAVTTGGRHACALLKGGGVSCWGSNTNGQLGNGTTTGSPVPVAVINLPAKAAAVSVGGTHSCALLVDGSVWCWGSNGKGELGNGATSDSSTPVAVTGLPAAVQISAGGNLSGGDSTCALTMGGAVFCWGGNSAGQLGNGSTSDSDVPVQVTGLTSAVLSVANDGATACATLISEQVECWGDNSVDELGDGSSGGISTVPVLVAGITALGTSLSSENGASVCALDISAHAQCWGWNTDGQLGNGSTSDSDMPTPVLGV